MITGLKFTNIYVLDQARAYDFYVNKLGFRVSRDVQLDFSKRDEHNYSTSAFRWLTLNPPSQPGIEVILSPVAEGFGFTRESAEMMRTLIRAGTFGFVIWSCRNLPATYEELKMKGVEFTKSPTAEAYGFEALFKDDSGNWFSLMQLPEDNN